MTAEHAGDAQRVRTPYRWRLAIPLVAGVLILGGVGAWIITTKISGESPSRAPVAIPGQLTIAGPNPIAFAGPQGGPFSPPKISLEVKAGGPGFHWSADESPSWLNLIPNQGDLVDNSSAEIETTVVSTAQSLVQGSYQGTIIFRNHSSGSIATRGVSLLVSPKPISQSGPLSPESERALKPGDGFKECPACPTMVVVRSGAFVMGSSDDQPLRDSDEGPQHEVTVKRQFAVGKFAITFDEWDACRVDGGCNHDPEDEGWGRGTMPVIHVNWIDAKAYLTWLSKKTGKIYRLLSEAEREYVTRAGTKTPFWFGKSISLDQANFGGADAYTNSSSGFRKQTVPVDTFAPNPWGLYQVHGNIREWTEDCYNDSYEGAPRDGSPWLRGNCNQRVLRNGSWVNKSALLRSAFRGTISTNEVRSGTIGFRVARTLPAP
jgi:formylglycine-generating enzyme required for sulfatase activity